MVKQYTQRAWRLAMTVAPLAAVALALAAGTMALATVLRR